ncbi:MAG TPA: hypothetical protein DCM86_06675 [Verrucomicrobiales bacterium]|nr:hypothetical protein [Verrucomicrobiales bacterium]
MQPKLTALRLPIVCNTPRPSLPKPAPRRLEVQEGRSDDPESVRFEVPIHRIRRAIVQSYAMGIYDSRTIVMRITTLSSPGTPLGGVRVDSDWVRRFCRQERRTIESELASLLSGRGGVGRLGQGAPAGALYFLLAARERVKLASWVDSVSRVATP